MLKKPNKHIYYEQLYGQTEKKVPGSRPKQAYPPNEGNFQWQSTLYTLGTTANVGDELQWRTHFSVIVWEKIFKSY